MKESTLKAYQKLEEETAIGHPKLGAILENDGHIPLAEYARRFFAPPVFNLEKNDQKEQHKDDRKNECIKAIRNQASRLLGEEVAASVEKQLKEKFVVSTTDHHGPLVDPFFFNAAWLRTTVILEDNLENRNVIILAFGNVSLGNGSFPRGLLYHSTLTGNMQKIFFSPAKDRSKPVFGYAPYAKTILNEAQNKLTQLSTDGGITNDQNNKLQELITDVYSREEVLACDSYADQITRSNFLFWQKQQQFLESNSLKEIRPVKLVFLQQEEIVISLILDHHLNQESSNRKSEIYSLIFDQKIQERTEKLFDTITGAFDLQKKTGTFLFWYLTLNNERLSLFRKGRTLTTLDGHFVIELAPENIAKLLKAGKLIPGTMLSLLVLEAYYRLECVGGFSQVDYLPKLLSAYFELFGLEQIDFPNYMGGENIVTLINLRSRKKLATGIDLFLEANESLLNRSVNQSVQEKFSQASKMITVRESLQLILPDIYKIFHKKDDPWIKEEHITDLLDSLPACLGEE